MTRRHSQMPFLRMHYPPIRSSKSGADNGEKNVHYQDEIRSTPEESSTTTLLEFALLSSPFVSAPLPLSRCPSTGTERDNAIILSPSTDTVYLYYQHISAVY